jgi:hypothetical protein
MKRIQKICQDIPGIGRVASQARALEELARITRNAVPEPMQSHVLACAVRDRTLIVFTDTAAWGSQIRFIQTAILDALADTTGHRLKDIRFKIQQTATEQPVDPGSQPTVKKRNPHTISKRSRQLIASAAEGIEDEQLAAALMRLARGRGSQDA